MRNFLMGFAAEHRVNEVFRKNSVGQMRSDCIVKIIPFNVFL